MIKTHVPLKQLNTWRVGGPAEYFIEPETPEQLAEFFSNNTNLFSKVTWLGLGSNVLVPDKGLTGLVISTIKLKKLELIEPNLVYAQAGATCSKLSKFCLKANLSGGEFFAGIPGTVGGALAMNAGAFGGETWPLVRQVDMINLAGKMSRQPATEFNYGYRHVTNLNNLLWEYHGFLAGIFCFQPASLDGAKENIPALLKKRSETQPIGTFNCGSVFRNPSGYHAARLIELCGLKGKRIGGAVVSLKHANFIINDNNATAEEIYKLIKEVKNTVFQETGVTLVPEVKFLDWEGSEIL